MCIDAGGFQPDMYLLALASLVLATSLRAVGWWKKSSAARWAASVTSVEMPWFVMYMKPLLLAADRILLATACRSALWALNMPETSMMGTSDRAASRSGVSR